MPKLIHTQKLSDNLTLGVQVGPGVQGSGYYNKELKEHTHKGQGVYTARIKFPGQTPKFRTTGIKYDDGSNMAREAATKKAYEILAENADIVARGGDINKVNYLKNKVGEYLEDSITKAEENDDRIAEGLDPLHRHPGGKTHWTMRSYQNSYTFWKKYLFGFVNQLPYDTRFAGLRIEEVDPRDLDQLDEYLVKVQPDLSIETRLKANTELRHFFHWAYDQRLIDTVPSIKRPFRGGRKGARERMRKEIDPETYRKIIEYTRSRYLDESESKYRRDYAYLFHLYILILANTGIRPPSGSTEHTLMRWKHAQFGKEGKKPILHRPNEKLHEYDAMILPSAVEYFQELKNFYKHHKMACKPNDYIFRHPYTSTPSNTASFGENWEGGVAEFINTDKRKLKTKGDPIKSFKGQWKNMLKKLELTPKATAGSRVRQSEQISFSSLRAWFITQRLYADSNVDIHLLAAHTGTSVGEIETRYLRLDMQKSYDYLAAGAWDNTGKERVYIDGYYAGHK